MHNESHLSDSDKPVAFRTVKVGQTFDFIDNSRPGLNSFYARCTKTGTRTYSWVASGQTLSTSVGTINVAVYHVETPEAIWTCSGDGPATHVACDFRTNEREDAFRHFEATGHSVDGPDY